MESVRLPRRPQRLVASASGSPVHSGPAPQENLPQGAGKEKRSRLPLGGGGLASEALKLKDAEGLKRGRATCATRPPAPQRGGQI